ncbi:MAG TPA: glycosyltransferase family 4 protein [Polyangiaceae bacterium]
MAGPERIAIVTTSYPRRAGDAAGHFVESEARRLARQGHTVTVLAPGRLDARADGVVLRAIADRGAFGWPGAIARLKEHPARVLGASEFVIRAVRALEETGPYERVIAHFLVPSGWPIATRALRRAPTTALEVVGHGSDVRLIARLPGALRRYIVRELLERGARFRFVSSALKGELVRATVPELAGSSIVEPSPIDVSSAPSRSLARSQLALPDDHALAVVVARLVPGKNVASALSAIALVPNLHAVVVGDGPLRAELAAHFPSARFVGQLSRPDSLVWIAAADVLVNASHEEGAPTVVREARALGVPVASVSAGDLQSWAESDAGIWLTTG